MTDAAHPRRAALPAALALALAALASGPAQAQNPATAVSAASAPPAAAAKAAAKKSAPAVKAKSSTTAAAAGNNVGNSAVRSTVKSAPKPAVAKPTPAAKNIALGPASVPAVPKALVAHGCLDAAHGRWLSAELGEHPAELQSRSVAALLDDAPAPGALHCVPFASVLTPARRIEALAFLPETDAAADARRAMVVKRAEPGGLPSTRWQELFEANAAEREVWLPLGAVMNGDAADQIPTRWQRELTLLLRQMKKHSNAADEAWVRLVLQDSGDAGTQLLAVELVDESLQALDSAIWLTRSGAPSGFVSTSGGDYERVLWQSPVDYRRISRGVGASTVIVKRRVMAPPRTPGGPPRVVIRSFRTRGQHLGVDFAAPPGTTVVTVAEGTVVHAAKQGGYGNLVVVDHGSGITTYYAHLSAFGAGIQEGAKVERGQEIGLVGSTGMSTGPHLHYEIRKDGRYLDPADPTQALANWSLQAEEHDSVLTRLLQLSLSRAPAFARAARGTVPMLSPQQTAGTASGAAAAGMSAE